MGSPPFGWRKWYQHHLTVSGRDVSSMHPKRDRKPHVALGGGQNGPRLQRRQDDCEQVGSLARNAANVKISKPGLHGKQTR